MGTCEVEGKEPSLRILDALADLLPETPADRQRQRDRERIESAIPEIEPGEQLLSSYSRPLGGGRLRWLETISP